MKLVNVVTRFNGGHGVNIEGDSADVSIEGLVSEYNGGNGLNRVSRDAFVDLVRSIEGPRRDEWHALLDAIKQGRPKSKTEVLEVVEKSRLRQALSDAANVAKVTDWLWSILTSPNTATWLVVAGEVIHSYGR